jgi:hypothetical protein
VCFAWQSHKGARGSSGNRNKTITRQIVIKKVEHTIVITTFAAINKFV